MKNQASQDEHPAPALPVLDLRDLGVATGTAERRRSLELLRETCHTTGFFYLTGHGVDTALNERVQRVTRAFFALPEADKLAVAMIRSSRFRGYTPLHGELTNGCPDLREEIDLGPERQAPALTPADPAWRRLLGPNQWPAPLPQFRTAMLDWHQAMNDVGHKVLRAIALCLGQEIDCFDNWIDPAPEATIKAIHYPGPRRPGSDQGVDTHWDFGLLTFVLQDHVGGLQVEHHGQFIDIPHISGAFVVNLGEMLQLATHGYLKATVHRVISPPPGTDRFSVIYFFNPRLDATLSPIQLPTALAERAPGGNSTDPANPILARYGDNVLKVRLRAHPDVALRHHADLLTTSSGQ